MNNYWEASATNRTTGEFRLRVDVASVLRVLGFSGSGSVTRDLVRQARVAAAERRFADAAFFYEEALRLHPGQARWQVQAGHMHKEAGHYDAAERHYLTALRLLPKDPDLALQLGHFHKLRADLPGAEAQYRRAAALKPGWALPLQEILGLRKAGWLGHAACSSEGTDAPPQRIEALAEGQEQDLRPEDEEFPDTATAQGLIPKLTPKPLFELMHAHREELDVRRLGNREESFWGMRRTLRGVEAVRGFCISRTPIVDATILLNGLAIARSAVSGGYPLAYESDPENIRKYVFNIWLDFSPFAHGLHALELRLTDAAGETRSFHDHVVIADPLKEIDFPRSDGIVEIDPQDRRSIDEQIRGRPSMIRDAHRVTFPDGVRNLLAMRTDQLGDVVASIPALRRLRELLPETRIVGLLTSANADLARTLGLFDEIIIADFPDDPTQRRRVMTLEKQQELRERLKPYAFDIAIDLAHSNVSRDLLPLSGAKFLYGHGGGDWPWLSGVFEFNTRDRHSLMDTTSHSTKVLALVEALGAILANHAPVIRRDDLAPEQLLGLGLSPGDRFVLLHTGARLKFSHWPYYAELAAALLDRTNLKVVMISDDPSARGRLSKNLLASDRFLLIDRRLGFDDFDALISFAAVVVGNDSGPKHLAGLRGTPVVTLFTARINWTEWGQEEVGKIITRRIPCQGCAIFHDPEECGKDFACIRDIRVDEVLDTVLQYV